MIGLVLLGYVGLVPQTKRQKGADERLKKRKIAEYKKDNFAHLKAEYAKLGVEDRQRWKTEEYYYDNVATIAVLNAELRYPEIRWTDARLIVTGTLLSATVVLFQSLIPAC